MRKGFVRICWLYELGYVSIGFLFILKSIDLRQLILGVSDYSCRNVMILHSGWHDLAVAPLWLCIDLLRLILILRLASVVFNWLLWLVLIATLHTIGAILVLYLHLAGVIKVIHRGLIALQEWLTNLIGGEVANRVHLVQILWGRELHRFFNAFSIL